jgi:hypothetical protein
MVKDKYHQDENDFEDFEDFEEFYGLEQEAEDELKELDFNDLEKKSIEDSSLNSEENEESEVPVIKERDIYQELRYIGLTHEQCSEVMNLIDTL